MAPDGSICVVEAKGGGSPLGEGYGHRQATPEWAVKSAERVMRSPGATYEAKEASKRVLEAAAEKKLKVYLIRTPHVRGKAKEPIVELVMGCSDEAARMAREILAPTPVAKMRGESREKNLGVGMKVLAESSKKAALLSSEEASAVRAAGRAGKMIDAEMESARVLRCVPKVDKSVAKTAGTMAMAIDLGMAVHEISETEARFRNYEITQQERELRHAEVIAGRAGGWSGAWAGMWVGGEVGGAAGSCVAPGPGTAVGGVVGATAGGIVGYFVGEEAAREISSAAVKAVHDSGTTIAEMGSKAWRETKESAKWVGDKLSETWRWMVGN